MEIVNSDSFKTSKASFPLPIGIDEKETLQIESLQLVGNLIVVGNPLSKKEVFVDTVLLTFLLRYSPRELRLILSDQGHYLDLYNGIPHLLAPTITDFDKTVSALRWAMSEMERRMKLFSQAGVREIEEFNTLSGVQALPRILIVTFWTGPAVESIDALSLLTSTGVRAGIYTLIIADRANEKSLPQEIKSNVPAQVVFKVTSGGDSRAAGVTGAEKLEKGEILYRENSGKQLKLKAVFTPEKNVKNIVDKVRIS